jgi:hypothetical protein
MTRLLTLPITIPLRLAALQLRIVRGAAATALDLARDLAGGTPPHRERAAEAAAATAPPRPAPQEAPRPRPRRAARHATAARPPRSRRPGPTRGQAAAIREARRETEGEAAAASAGPAADAGPEVRIDAPWEGYDAMALDEVLARLEGADPALVAAVRLYESRHESRQAILLATGLPDTA